LGVAQTIGTIFFSAQLADCATNPYPPLVRGKREREKRNKEAKFPFLSQGGGTLLFPLLLPPPSQGRGGEALWF